MVMHYKFFDGMPKWPPSNYDLTYTFGSDGRPSCWYGHLEVCLDAFKKWSDFSQFTFQEASDAASANIVIAFYSGDHGDGHPFDVGQH